MNKDVALLGSVAAAMLAIPLAVVVSVGISLYPLAAPETPDTVYPASASGSAAQAAVSVSASESAGATAETGSCADMASFFLLDSETGKVQEIGALEYIRGVLAAEVPASYHIEALKAQAVAAYTVSVYEAKRQRADPDPALLGADFGSDAIAHQEYITEADARERFGDSFDYNWTRLTEAAEIGVSHMLLYDGEPILAAYHAISAGHTESSGNVWSGELPYLTGVDSNWDILAQGYKSTVTFGKEELQQLLTGAGFAPEGKISDWIAITERSAAGYVTEASVCGQTMSGNALRTLLGLRSSAFTLTYNAQSAVFEVKGYGHGAGLSQNGSDYMARQGSSYQEILSYYYPGSVLIP